MAADPTWPAKHRLCSGRLGRDEALPRPLLAPPPRSASDWAVATGTGALLSAFCAGDALSASASA